MELLEVDSPVDKVFSEERALSDAIAQMIAESEGEFRLDQETREGIRELLRKISEVQAHSKSRSEYKWCVDTLEKWRYFLIANGDYIPFPKRRLPDFLQRANGELPRAEEVRRLGSGHGRVIKGHAVRDSFDKTAKIRVETQKRDSLTGKTVRRSKTYLVHDELNEVSEGDFVRAKECRPVSKNKKFVVVGVDSKI